MNSRLAPSPRISSLTACIKCYICHESASLYMLKQLTDHKTKIHWIVLDESEIIVKEMCPLSRQQLVNCAASVGAAGIPLTLFGQCQ